MRKVLTVLFIGIWLLSIGAERGEPHREELNFEAAGFQRMHTTAYILQGTTADGGHTRPYICASSIDHIGDLAIVYTIDGDYLGMYLCTDTGREGGGVRAGTVLDVWRKNMTQATSYMKVTGGECWVLWIKGNG